MAIFLFVIDQVVIREIKYSRLKRNNMTIVTYYAVLATLVLIAHSNVCVNAEEELVDLDITVNQCPMSRTKTKPSPEAKLRYCTEKAPP